MAITQDTCSPGQAAKILEIGERTVGKMLDRGGLEGEHDGAGESPGIVRRAQGASRESSHGSSGGTGL